jgi:hypothetical protein
LGSFANPARKRPKSAAHAGHFRVRHQFDDMPTWPRAWTSRAPSLPRVPVPLPLPSVMGRARASFTRPLCLSCCLMLALPRSPRRRSAWTPWTPRRACCRSRSPTSEPPRDLQAPPPAPPPSREPSASLAQSEPSSEFAAAMAAHHALGCPCGQADWARLGPIRAAPRVHAGPPATPPPLLRRRRATGRPKSVGSRVSSTPNSHGDHGQEFDERRGLIEKPLTHMNSTIRTCLLDLIKVSCRSLSARSVFLFFCFIH